MDTWVSRSGDVFASPRQTPIALLCTIDDAVLEAGNVLKSVGYAVVACSSLAEVQAELAEKVQGVVLDAGLPKSETFEIYRFLRRETAVPVLVLLPPAGDSQSGWSMEAEHGETEDFVRKPLGATELVLRFNALLVRAGVTPPGALGLESNVQAAAALSGFGRIICVFGAHGGVGKTTVAVHLATGLAQETDSRVALVDGDLWMGDVIANLNLTASRNILDAVFNGIPSDPEVWTQVMVEHSSGVRVLAPPIHLEEVERVPDGAVAAAAQALRRYYDFVVVDLDDTPTEANLKVLDVADLILVVMTPEMGVVRNTLRLLAVAAEIGLKDRCWTILNRSDTGLERKQVESVIPSQIMAAIPSDWRLFVSAVNLGRTAFDVDGSAGSHARRALDTLVRDVADQLRPRSVRSAQPRASGTATLRQKLPGKAP